MREKESLGYKRHGEIDRPTNDRSASYRVWLVSEGTEVFDRSSLPSASLPILVIVFPHKLLIGHGGCTESGAQNGVYFLHEPLFLCAESSVDSGRRDSLALQSGMEPAKDKSMFA